MSLIKKLNRICKKTTIWGKIFFGLFLLLILLLIVNKYTPKKEGFTQKKKFVLKEGPKIFDDFYASIYDDLVYSKVKNDFEIGEIIRATKPTEESVLLDVGSAAGHHVNLFSKKGIKTTGIDISPNMIQRSKKLYPDLDFRENDVLQYSLFQNGTFTHITCLYFTIYYIKDKLQFFQNCFDWLLPGGYLAIHLVNRDMFDPILPSADPLLLISAQKYAKKRITNSLVKFKDFHYKANFKLKKKDDLAIFEETFTNDGDGHIRQNTHTLYMPTQKYILSLAKDVGFVLLGKVDMVTVQYEYQYIYILYKPE